MGLARILPTISGNISLPQLDYAALVAAGVHVPEFIEPGMDGDFSFDLSNGVTYKSRVSPFEMDRTGKTVTLMDNSAGKYLIMSPGLNGLVGPTPDQREMTYAALCNYRVATGVDDVQVIAGAFADTSGPGLGVGGDGIQIAANGSIAAQIRGLVSSPSIAQSAIVAQGLNLGVTNQFLFVAMTSRLTGGADEETEHTLFVGGAVPQTSVRTGVKLLAPRNVAVGNAYRQVAIFNTMSGRFGRFFSGPGFRSVAQLTAMYQRAKIVADRRGMEVI